MPVQTVVLPVDFSERSQGAARYAEALSALFGGRIHLIHVLPPPHYEMGALEVGGAMLADLFRARQEQANQDLQTFLAAELPEERTERILLEGDPAAKIVEYAHNVSADLIVMPTHGYGTFRRFILGSVTAKVLHDADCPVWTGVHLESHSVEQVRFRNICAAVDLGPQSERTLMWASRFAAATQARLYLAHATPRVDGRGVDYVDPEWQAEIDRTAREQIQALIDRLQIKAEVRVDAGDAAACICELARELDSDVLVIGRGSASGVFGRLRASAYSIIRMSACPVVSV